MAPFQLKYNISAIKIDVKSSANAEKHMIIDALIKRTLRLFSARLDCQELSSVSTYALFLCSGVLNISIFLLESSWSRIVLGEGRAW